MKKSANDSKRMEKKNQHAKSYTCKNCPTLFRIDTKLSMLADKQNLSYLSKTPLHHQLARFTTVGGQFLL